MAGEHPFALGFHFLFHLLKFALLLGGENGEDPPSEPNPDS